MAKPILLTVDDDPDVLRAIERDLRSHYGAEYRVISSDAPASISLSTRFEIVCDDNPVCLLISARESGP